eukprot:PhM_4_TR1946/c1_g1_i1/m.91894
MVTLRPTTLHQFIGGKAAKSEKEDTSTPKKKPVAKKSTVASPSEKSTTSRTTPKASKKTPVDKPVSLRGKAGRVQNEIPGIAFGAGTEADPIRLPLRDEPNASGCLHCPIGVESCDCVETGTLVWSAIRAAGIERVSGHRQNNAKSIMPVFVSRVARLLGVTKSDVFWDLGCGNGSVVMQVAMQTGATCVGVELQPENIVLAEAVWPIVRKAWNKLHPERPAGKCIFIAEDMFVTLKRRDVPTPTTLWAANLLFPAAVNYRLSEVLLSLPKLRTASVMSELWPHSRPLARKRNPVPYETFEMVDYESQPGGVEWSETETQRFRLYKNKKRDQSRSSSANSNVSTVAADLLKQEEEDDSEIHIVDDDDEKDVVDKKKVR